MLGNEALSIGSWQQQGGGPSTEICSVRLYVETESQLENALVIYNFVTALESFSQVGLFFFNESGSPFLSKEKTSQN